jgi:hypothetical protein
VKRSEINKALKEMEEISRKEVPLHFTSFLTFFPGEMA